MTKRKNLLKLIFSESPPFPWMGFPPDRTCCPHLSTSVENIVPWRHFCYSIIRGWAVFCPMVPLVWGKSPYLHRAMQKHPKVVIVSLDTCSMWQMCFLEIDLNPRHGVVSKLCGGGRSHRRSCCLQIPSVGSHHHHHLPLFSSCKSDNNNSCNPDTPQRLPRKKKCGHWFSEKILQPSQRFNSSWNQLWWEESAFFLPFQGLYVQK